MYRRLHEIAPPETRHAKRRSGLGSNLHAFIPKSPTKINRRDLFTFVAKFSTDDETSIPIDSLLIRRKRPRRWATGCGSIPPRQLSVAQLCIRVSMPMNVMDASLRALICETVQLLDEAAIGGDETAPPGKRLRVAKQPALCCGSNRNPPRAPSFAPAWPEYQPIPSISPCRLDLDRFGTPQSKCCLQSK